MPMAVKAPGFGLRASGSDFPPVSLIGGVLLSPLTAVVPGYRAIVLNLKIKNL